MKDTGQKVLMTFLVNFGKQNVWQNSLTFRAQLAHTGTRSKQANKQKVKRTILQDVILIKGSVLGVRSGCAGWHDPCSALAKPAWLAEARCRTFEVDHTWHMSQKKNPSNWSWRMATKRLLSRYKRSVGGCDIKGVLTVPHAETSLPLLRQSIVCCIHLILSLLGVSVVPTL